MSMLRKHMDFLGLSIKKEILKLIIINIILIGIIITSFIFLNQPFLSIMVGVSSLFIDYYLFSSYSSKKNRIIREREDEFVSIISYFKIFISNKSNVYHSLECLKPYSSNWMANELDNLLNDIDHDKSIQPFVAFAKNFNSPTIENVMISIYQMVDEGESEDRLTQFAFTFEQFSREHKEHLIDAKQKSLDTINVFPLAGAGLITMILMFTILTVIGDLNNVI